MLLFTQFYLVKRRKMSPNIFTVNATCRASGEILLPPTEESITGKKFVPQGIHGLQKVVQSRLGVTVRAWEKFAFLQGVIGILICIPWIWALAKWDFTGLAYKP